jgi:hypothetical protein
VFVSLFVSHYSFLLVAILFVIVAASILLTHNPKWNDYLAFGLIVLALVSAWGILRPRQTMLMEDAQMVQAIIGSGTPVLLEFQSPY